VTKIVDKDSAHVVSRGRSFQVRGLTDGKSGWRLLSTWPDALYRTVSGVRTERSVARQVGDLVQ